MKEWCVDKRDDVGGRGEDVMGGEGKKEEEGEVEKEESWRSKPREVDCILVNNA